MSKKYLILFAILLTIAMLTITSAAWKRDVYDYYGKFTREKVNYSHFNATRFTGINVTVAENITSTGGWLKGIFNWLIGSTSINYLSFNGTDLTFSESFLNNTIDTRSVITNTSMKSYVDSVNASQTTWTVANVTGTNTSMKNYVDSLDTSTNTTMKSYVDALDTATNTTMKNYVDALDTATNTSMKTYVDGLNGTWDGELLDGYDSTYFMPLNTSVYGTFDFDGGWTSGGLSIDSGDLYAQTIYVYNITSLNVTEQNLTIMEEIIVYGNTELKKNLTVDTNTLFVDSNNDRVGIGTTGPGALLDVGGGSAGSIDGTDDLLVKDDVEIDGDLYVDGNVATPALYEVSDEGLVFGVNFNSEDIVGSAGSEKVLDSSGYNHHGTNSGATHNSSGSFNGGGAFEFDGNDDVISLGDPSAMDFGTDDWTISVWVKQADADKSSNQGIVGKYGSYPSFTLMCDNGNSRIFIYDGTSSRSVKGGDCADGTWHHVVATHDHDGSTTLYYDTVSQGTSSTALNTLANNNDWLIGSRDTGATKFNGAIDEVRVYNRVLSTSEVKALYSQREEAENSYVNQNDVYVDSSGNVGIGTSSPTVELDVRNVGGGNNAQIQVKTTADSARLILDQEDTANEYSQVIFKAGGNQKAQIRSDNNGNVLFQSGGSSDAMYIDSSQQVGIGTITPTEKLTVDGTMNVTGIAEFTGGYIRFNDGATLTGYIGDAVNLGFAGLTNDDLVIRGADGIGFTSNDGSSDAMYINSSGNVGIGTTTPQSLLHLFGDEKALRISSDDQIIATLGNLGSGASVDRGMLQLYDAGNVEVSIHTGNVDSYFNSGQFGFGTTTPENTLNVVGDFNQSGSSLAFMNNVYGEMSYHNDTGTELNFATQGLFYNMTFDSSLVNGMTFNDSDDHLEVDYGGVYKVIFFVIGDGQNNHEYHLSVSVNGVSQDKCESKKKLSSGGDILTMNGHCLLSLSVDDEIKVIVVDYGGTGTGNYYGGNLNVMRIGN